MSFKMSSWNVMGILNVTPDSFYDGGKYTETYLQRARYMYENGAHIIDVGGESTRPGAPSVSEQEELDRVIPVIENIVRTVPLSVSIDTTKAAVASEALNAGAVMVNDISGGRFDPELPRIAAQHNAFVVVMHSRNDPQTMQNAPRYTDVISEVRRELIDSITDYRNAGVLKERIIADPGIGFAKTAAHNLMVLKSLKQLDLEYPLLIGASRKSFLGTLTGREPEERLAASLAVAGYAAAAGASFFRVHDVAETVDYLKTFSAIEDCNT
ncbi:MAG: dihydropteroate synthase [Fibrobacterota bacterium]